MTLAFGEIIKNIINVLYIAKDGSGFHFAISNGNAIDLADDGVWLINGAKGIAKIPHLSSFTAGVILILISLFVVYNLVNSRSGRAIMAIRDNRIAAESIGIDMSSESNVTNLSYAIGGWNKGISPVEMASAYATISNNGLYTESHTINYVEVVQTGETFNIDEEIQNNAKQSAYSKASASSIRQVMLDYTKNGSGNYAYVSGINNVGAKTGTSNWSSSAKNGMAGKSRDLWMSAYTSDYICSVWMGFGQEGIEKGKTTSRYKAYPGKVVQTLLKHLQSKKGDKSYPSQPSTVVKDGDDYYKKGTKHEGHAAIYVRPPGRLSPAAPVCRGHQIRLSHRRDRGAGGRLHPPVLPDPGPAGPARPPHRSLAGAHPGHRHDEGLFRDRPPRHAPRRRPALSGGAE